VRAMSRETCAFVELKSVQAVCSSIWARILLKVQCGCGREKGKIMVRQGRSLVEQEGKDSVQVTVRTMQGSIIMSEVPETPG